MNAAEEAWRLNDADKEILREWARGDEVYTDDWDETMFAAVESIKAAAYRRALEDAADAVNLHRQVPRDRGDLEGLCEDDECLWWDMTYALRDELRARAAAADPHERKG